ncbi:HAD-IIA family hydrolase [Ferdinandcohnia quinoae]|uniref:Acid sugar phosphatase n=1 Tax=Fredinandcohnia quinoae TaxID=2918902 RepID=A0AAW5DTV4_9BACI|nr:HAD-IIA family hydrolase [Fredinandcohnia sp. SECRCQ15]MCH1624076.1 HAD-IIA family hydrolase [Fredinandcohnia sp. SECRCQ15]
MVKGFIFDLDGTVYLDDQVIEGAVETIISLRERGHKIVFLTNKSIATRIDYVNKLNKLGIPVTLDEVINSNYITMKYLKDHMKEDDAALVIGEEPLFQELREENINLTNDPQKATYVVLGWDRQFNYEKLNIAYQAWLNKAIILATNPDRTCPVYGGSQIPDCGAIIGALEGATGQPIDSVIGKPSRLTAEFVVNEILNLKPEQCYMVGDRLETDIRMGFENGLNTVLVLTGVSTAEMVKETHYKPTYVFNSIKEIVNI